MPRSPIASLPTHEVTNQVPLLDGYDTYATDVVLQEAVAREGAGWAADRVAAMGRAVGSPAMREAGRLANQHPPTLHTFDRTGHRIDEVEFHPAYHQLMALGMEHGVHNLAWTAPEPGGHVAHLAMEYQLYQVEAGVCCPLTMTYAVVPSLRHQPDLAAIWEPRVTASEYDPRSIPAAEKTAATMGMAMTEKQGGSDLRANGTRAVRDGEGWRLRGHKWFCSAPMCDAFLTVAYAEEGLSCFLVPRWLPDGSRNRFFLQRLKNKLGNRANASSEVEYDDTFAWMVGEPGRGIPTIIDMVQHTRLDCCVSAASIGRAGLVEAMHHARHRQAFGAKLVDKPLMRNVLADLAIEVEASTILAFRLARAYDQAETDAHEASLSRIGVAIGKYWTNKRCAPMVAEAMECLGGAGYIEESILPRLYREAPLNGIWEGSGNVICLDVLRAGSREPDTMHALVAELDGGLGMDARIDRAIHKAKRALLDSEFAEFRARRTTEAAALALQGLLVARHGSPAVAEAFIATRLDGDWGHAFGTLPPGHDLDAILGRAWPEQDV